MNSSAQREDELAQIFAQAGKNPKVWELIPVLAEHGYVIKRFFVPDELGIDNYLRFDEKLAFINKRREEAYIDGYYFEYVSLLLLEIEVFLRIFLYNVGDYSGLHFGKDEQSFGQLVHRSLEAGLPKHLTDRLFQIIRVRNDYMHGFLTSRRPYSTITGQKSVVDTLPSEIHNYVVSEVCKELDENIERERQLNPDEEYSKISAIRIVKKS